MDETSTTIDINSESVEPTDDFKVPGEVADKVQGAAKVIGVPFKKGFDERRNYDGRPTQTLKEFQAKEFQNMTDEQKRDYLADIDKKTKWEMAEGRPQTNTDITSGGDKIIPIYGNLSKRLSDEEDIPAEEENKSDFGRD